MVFGKNAEALRELARVFREDGLVTKTYCTIVHGKLEEPARLTGKIIKDEAKNIGKILPLDDDRGKYIETVVRPIEWSRGAYGSGAGARGYSLIEADLITGRSHQIRAHLSSIGHPLAGDVKYGGRPVHAQGSEFALGRTTQALHAYRVHFTGAQGCLEYLNGQSFTAGLPEAWEGLQNGLFGKVIVKSE